jgi:hypothetical protein
MALQSPSLEDAARVLTWVRVAGYALEKIHTGVLVHALTSNRPAACALAASLWNQVTTASLAAENITKLHAAPEVSLGDGADSVIDLLISFQAHGQRHLLGLEMKVDASPRKEQLERLRDGVRAKSGAAHATALVALGGAQVCRIERGDPTGVTRLGVDDLLAHAALLRDAGDPAIVDPWLQELAFEAARRDHADEVTEGTSARFGYRSRTLRTYQYARLSKRVEKGGGEAWQVSVQSHNVIATGTDSWRDLPGSGAPTKLYLELTDEAICLKAGCWQGHGDPRKESAVIVERAFAGFRAAGLTVVRPTQRRGTSATLCKIPVNVGEDLAPQLLVASRAWATIWEDFTMRNAAAKQPGDGA